MCYTKVIHLYNTANRKLLNPYCPTLYPDYLYSCKCANFTPVYSTVKGGKMQEKRVGLSHGAKLNSLVFYVLILSCGLNTPPR